jgi:5-methylcytosine-specific restriction protein A
LVRGARHCDRHAALAEAEQASRSADTHRRYNAKRDESDSFYKTERWRKLSVHYRRTHPVCECCNAAASEITDHIQPLKARPDLALSWDNLRALCRACHNRIGARVGLVGGRA